MSVRVQAQQSIALPSGWQQMSPTDFAAAIRPLVSSGTFRFLSPSDQQSARNHGLELFRQVDIASTSLSYQTLEMLQWLSDDLADQSTVDKAKAALLGRQDNWSGQPFAEVLAKVLLMKRLGIPAPTLLSQAEKWVAAGGTQAQIPQADLVYDIARQLFANPQDVTGSFAVAWSTSLTAPQSGDYTFFLSPINVNSGFKKEPYKLRMTLSVAGQTLLESIPQDVGTPAIAGYEPSAPPPEWTSQSTPITLTAGQPVSLQVTVSVDAPESLPAGTSHAMLFWQGPGLAKSLVPASSFTLLNGSGPGLQSTYSWRSQGQPQSLTRTDSTIDFAWTNPAILLSQNTTVFGQAGDQMWQAMTSQDFLSSLAGPPAQVHPFLLHADDSSVGLSTARRQAFLNLLLQNPTLLDLVDAPTAVRFYQAFRMGTPDVALDVFGTWAGRHANLFCELSDSRYFDIDNRTALAAMAVFTTQQLPTQAPRLQSEYLQLPNGQCVLPVAYTLSYSYLGLHKQAAWIAFLDAKLADPTLTGDLRVNWILARAHIQELLRNPSKHYPQRWPTAAEWPLDGRRYLDQALDAAQSPSVKLRVAREIIGRLASAEEFQEATTVLEQLANSLPAPQKGLAAAWQQRLAGFAAYKQAQPTRAKQAYLNTLRARLAQATNSGDSAAVQRYNNLINVLQNRP